MDREEAIDLLDNLIGFVEDNHGSDYDKALKMAIEALKEHQKTGHWISLGVQGEVDGQIVQVFTCSECGAISIFRMASGNIVNGDICPNCGAKMKGGD